MRAVKYARDAVTFAVQCATKGTPSPRSGVRAASERSRAAPRLFPSDGVTKEANSSPARSQSRRREAPRDEKPARRGIAFVLVGHRRETGSMRAGRPDRRFRDRERRQDHGGELQPVSSRPRTRTSPTSSDKAKRYTLSTRDEISKTDGRDGADACWFPLRRWGPFSDLTDTLLGDPADGERSKCGCHPKTRKGTSLVKSARRRWSAGPVPRFEQVHHRVQRSPTLQGRTADAGRDGAPAAQEFSSPDAARGLHFRYLIRQF